MEQHYQNRVAVRDGLRSWLTSTDWNYFVTVRPNSQTATDVSGRKLLARFRQHLNRKLFGRRYFKIPSSAQVRFVAFPEVAASGLHYHTLVGVPEGKHTLFSEHAAEVLKGISAAADCQIVPIRTEEDRERIVSYITKDGFRQSSIEQFFVS